MRHEGAENFLPRNRLLEALDGFYVLVGASALWQLYPLTRATQVGETLAEAGEKSVAAVSWEAN